MLLAYIDEIGETGAFISRTHSRFNTSPAFGYAGFIIPAENARQLGQEFTIEKRRLFRNDIAKAPEPARWERKGADIFRPDSPETQPHQLRVFKGLVKGLRRLGGSLFYYADEKPIGTPKQTSLNTKERELAAMRETLNRLCTHADAADENLLVMIDQINEKQRAARLPKMYGHILSRATERHEMKRIIEPPMHIDSVLSSNIQFADWIAAAVSRAIDYQLISDSRYKWVPDRLGESLRGAFTHESKLHLWYKSVPDFNHFDVFKHTRPLHPRVSGQTIASAMPKLMARMHEAAIRADNKN
ncbi:DUF3800 domain-containing protein [Rathayibacter soli]|uniref:DUF3800 domain-containing protein n=1 Tax=Rathayibacter soli TaxID=3144168 RepID=UPI0027E406F4|nr:DUF3800 domain-containing protein [Glaciibacter superstes]